MYFRKCGTSEKLFFILMYFLRCGDYGGHIPEIAVLHNGQKIYIATYSLMSWRRTFEIFLQLEVCLSNDKKEHFVYNNMYHITLL